MPENFMWLYVNRFIMLFSVRVSLIKYSIAIFSTNNVTSYHSIQSFEPFGPKPAVDCLRHSCDFFIGFFRGAKFSF